MARTINNKLRTLFIMDELLQKTDEKHRLGTGDLLAMLERNGLKAERKSIYDDIETLNSYGLDVMYSKERPAGYYIASRDFELPELKLLVDAVQASKFITARKSHELISKLEKLASTSQARQLQRQVYVTNRVKAINENIYYNVDRIHEAIQNDSVIKFKYYKWNVRKELEVRNGGKPIEISPWALTWDDENYYMLGYDELAGIVKHYRVDKMKDIELTGRIRDGQETFNDFDIAGFAKRTFGMFGGRSELVTLECDNDLIGAVIDRFGSDIVIMRTDDERFRIRQELTVSGQFYGWLVGLGPKIRIVEPENVAAEFRQRLKSMID